LNKNPGSEGVFTELERLGSQISFLIEVDKLANVFRRSYLNAGERFENSAEHSWHVALMALTLEEYADCPIDIARVVKMLLLHDLVEIDAGDTFIYDKAGKASLRSEEEQAAARIFGILPEEQCAEFVALWREFEDKSTPDARFAGAMDRLMPILHNYYSKGKSWQEHNISSSQVLAVNAEIARGSAKLWEFAQEIIRDSVARGYLRDG
jgi:putative hydrolase of HD superfamily